MAHFLQTAAQRADAPTELTRCFFSRPTLQNAQEERKSMYLRQTLDFLIQHGQQFSAAQHVQRIRPRIDRLWRLWKRLDHLSTLGDGASFARHSQSDAAEETGQRFGSSQIPRFAGQDKKSRLECIFGVGHVAEDAAADTENHWAVTRHQNGKSSLVTLVSPTCQ